MVYLVKTVLFVRAFLNHFHHNVLDWKVFTFSGSCTPNTTVGSFDHHYINYDYDY